MRLKEILEACIIVPFIAVFSIVVMWLLISGLSLFLDKLEISLGTFDSVDCVEVIE